MSHAGLAFRQLVLDRALPGIGFPAPEMILPRGTNANQFVTTHVVTSTLLYFRLTS